MSDWLETIRDAREPDGALVERALASATPERRPWLPYAIGVGAAAAGAATVALLAPKPPARVDTVRVAIATPAPTPNAPRAIQAIRRPTVALPAIRKAPPRPVRQQVAQALRPTAPRAALPPTEALSFQFGAVRGERPAFLTPLPQSPASDAYTATFIQAGGRAQGTVALRQPGPKRLVHGALFDARGALLATATAPALADGYAALEFGRSRTNALAAHYLVALCPAPQPPRETVGGYVRETLAGTVDVASVSTVGPPEFYRSRVDRTLGARLTLAGSGDTRIDGALFDEHGALVGTSTAATNLTAGKPQEVTFAFDIADGATRYRFSIRPPEEPMQPAVPARNDDRLTLTVDTIAEGADGSLTLGHAPTTATWEEILKDPSLRDQKTVVLTPGVVKALRAKGTLNLKHATVRAAGKRESTLLLCFPAVSIESVTVERPEDLSVTFLPRGPYQTSPETPAGRVKQLDAARAKGESVYALVIGTEFDRLVNEAAKSDHAALIALIQHAWFGGPKDAPKGGNAITWAAYYPTAEPIRTLLSQGVAPGVADATGKTGLHRTYREEIARLLLEKGAPIEARDKDGQTPLLSQAQAANPWIGRGVLPLLLSRGADPNAVDGRGRTALMYAAAAGMADDVEALLKKGADPKRRDKDGKTALDLVKPWAWQMSPGFATQEILDQQRRHAEADAARILSVLPR